MNPIKTDCAVSKAAQAIATIAPPKRLVRARAPDTDSAIIRERMAAALAMNRLTSVEVAKRMGYKNSTQISLILSGARPIPHDWAFLKKFSDICMVSLDFLYGLNQYPQRDPIASGHFAVLRGFEDLMRHQSASMATAFIECAALSDLPWREVNELCDLVEHAASAIERMRDNPNNAELIPDLCAGSPVLDLVQQFHRATPAIRAAFDKRRSGETKIMELASGRRGPLAYLLEGRQNQLNFEPGHGA
jgi:transcriptional regulator with XRE-family HTH domain